MRIRNSELSRSACQVEKDTGFAEDMAEVDEHEPGKKESGCLSWAESTRLTMRVFRMPRAMPAKQLTTRRVILSYMLGVGTAEGI